MKNVLVVDDDEQLRETLVEYLQEFAHLFRTFDAANGREAINILKQNTIHFVLTDLNMAGVNGFQLLAYMLRHYPKTPVVIMTGYPTREVQERLANMGAFYFLEKPLDMEVVSKLILDETGVEKRGFLKGVTLASILQLLQQEGKSYTLYIKDDDLEGELYLDQGKLLDARLGIMRGEEAALEILSCQQPEVEIVDICKAKNQRIKGSMMGLIMESMRRLDERNRVDELSD